MKFLQNLKNLNSFSHSAAQWAVRITTHLNGGKLDLPSALKCMLYDIFLQILQIYNFIFTTFQKNFLYLKENFTFLIFLSGESRVLPLPCLALKFNFILKNLAWTDFSKYSNFFFERGRFSSVKKIQPLLRPCPKVILIFSASSTGWKNIPYSYIEPNQKVTPLALVK